MLKDKSWNTLAFQRKADKITISLNEKSVIELPADNMTRFGVMRPKERAVKIKSVMLTGDWPATLPEDWLAPKAP